MSTSESTAIVIDESVTEIKELSSHQILFEWRIEGLKALFEPTTAPVQPTPTVPGSPPSSMPAALTTSIMSSSQPSASGPASSTAVLESRDAPLAASQPTLKATPSKSAVKSTTPSKSAKGSSPKASSPKPKSSRSLLSADGIVSPNSADFKGYEWKFCFQPQSVEKKYHSYCGLWLDAIFPDYYPHQSAFSIILRIQTLSRSSVLSVKSEDYFLIEKGHKGSVSSFGAPDFVRRQDLYFDNALSKADDAILISAVITARSKELVPPLRFSAFSIFKGLAAVLDDPEAGDVAFVIQTKNGSKIVYAYSHVLMARSDYFKTLLSSDACHQGPGEDTARIQPLPIAALLEDSDAEVDEEPPVTTSSSTGPSSSVIAAPPKKKRRVIGPDSRRYFTIQGPSYITFRGLIEWLLTDDVELAPLLSEGLTEMEASSAPFTLDPLLALNPDDSFLKKVRKAHQNRSQHVDNFYGTVRRPCSPKSLYALAEQFNLPALQERCLVSILDSINSRNVLWETLSPFSVANKEVFKALTKILRRRWWNLPKTVVQRLHQHPNFGMVWAEVAVYVQMEDMKS